MKAAPKVVWKFALRVMLEKGKKENQKRKERGWSPREWWRMRR